MDEAVQLAHGMTTKLSHLAEFKLDERMLNMTPFIHDANKFKGEK